MDIENVNIDMSNHLNNMEGIYIMKKYTLYRGFLWLL